MTQGSLGDALAILGLRTHDANTLCQALGDHVRAWQVLSQAMPQHASLTVANAKADVEAIHIQFPETPPCLQTYSADLNRMGVPH
jgi:hypothetical protein